MLVHCSYILKYMIIRLFLYPVSFGFVAWPFVYAIVDTDQYHASTSSDIATFRQYYYIYYCWFILFVWVHFNPKLYLWIYLTRHMMFCSLKFTIAVRILLCCKRLKYVWYVCTYMCDYTPFPWGISVHQSAIHIDNKCVFLVELKFGNW